MSVVDPAGCGECGACSRDDALSLHENAAGLGQIEYRLGSHALFLRRMSGWLSRQAVPPNDPASRARPLAGLTTRATDDPAVALLDAWACALDVLTFYQERIANEGFLRTASERQSVLLLARAIGYQLGPGVAASAHLAFTLLDSDKAPREVTLPIGLQVQSVPGPGERPQTFETVESIVARPAHNALGVVTHKPQQLARRTTELVFEGLSTGLRAGDRLFILGRLKARGQPAAAAHVPWRWRSVVGVVADKAAGVTRVRLDRELGPSQGNLTGNDDSGVRVFAFSEQAHPFGHNAPDPRAFSAAMKDDLHALLVSHDTQWANFTLGVVRRDGKTTIDLSGELNDVVLGSFIVVMRGAVTRAYAVSEVVPSSRTDFMLSHPTTRLTLDTARRLQGPPRGVTVFAASRELALASVPIDTPVRGRVIVLEQVLESLEAGRDVIITGPSGLGDETTHAEVCRVASVSVEERRGSPRTVVRLSQALAQPYERTQSVVFGNVLRATHGKTVPKEVLGSGDGSRAFQAFTLRQYPVTHVATPSAGLQTTLSVRVNEVEWRPVSSTLGLGPNDTVYVALLDDAGKTTLTFGDGREGARLPSGSQNVSASYRVGIGLEGLVGAGQLSVLKTRPQGVKAVTNPLPATGAEDPETLDASRQNAPLTVLTLDRLVSVHDYEAYAAAYAGIGKAQAVRLWDGRRHWVHVTLAASDGAAVSTSDSLYQSLVSSIDARRDPVQRVRLDTFEPRAFKLRASLVVEPARVFEDVAGAVEVSLREAFSFGRRRFAQAVTGSEILKLVHATPGVLAVDLDGLWFSGEPEPPASTLSPASWVLPARGARYVGTGVARAELLLLDEGTDAVQLASAPA